MADLILKQDRKKNKRS